MSKRTSEANKAIAAAWNNEKQLVSEGKGTRDWTQEQQQGILEKGKAYDEDGRAFEGQHMKSVEQYPEYQGDPGNIQFLTKKEHLEAHRGNWQNPTNWYYNPETKQFTDFGDGKYIPCSAIELSEPIIIHINTPDSDSDNNEINAPEQDGDVEESPEVLEETRKSSSPVNNSPPNSVHVKPKAKEETIGFFRHLLVGISGRLKKAGKFVLEHRKEIGAAVIAIGGAVLEEKIRNSNSSRGNTYSEDGYVPHLSDNSRSSGYEDDSSDYSGYSDFTSDLSEDTGNDAIGGTPKSPHARRGYSGHRWKRNEDGELELSETWINETFIHKNQLDEDSE